jgi:hypothetical protein
MTLLLRAFSDPRGSDKRAAAVADVLLQIVKYSEKWAQEERRAVSLDIPKSFERLLEAEQESGLRSIIELLAVQLKQFQDEEMKDLVPGVEMDMMSLLNSLLTSMFGKSPERGFTSGSVRDEVSNCINLLMAILHLSEPDLVPNPFGHANVTQPQTSQLLVDCCD